MATTRSAAGDGRPREAEAATLGTRDTGVSPGRVCSQYNPRTMRYCHRGATMVGLGSYGDVFYCDKHGLENAARPIGLIEVARAEAENRAHGRVDPDAAIYAIAAVNLYVEAFLARVASAKERARRPA